MELVEFYALQTDPSTPDLRYQGVAAMIAALSTPAYHFPEAMDLIRRLLRRRRTAVSGWALWSLPRWLTVFVLTAYLLADTPRMNRFLYQFVPPGREPEIEHWLQSLRNGGRAGLRLTFEDKGPGIPDIELALKDGYTTGGGLGLGLAIARDIARSHGGDITLGDSPMGGLRAAVRIPV